MDTLYQIYYLIALGLAIFAGLLILGFHILSGREEE
jgi:hypothetical protein